MNLDNLLLRLQALRERVAEMQADCSEALPQAYLPELTATTIAEVTTALSELQSELRGVSDRWQLATNTLNSIIYDWDIERRSVDRTQGLFDVLGYRPEEVLPTLDWWTSRIHPNDKERVRNEVRDALATQIEFGTEYRILNKGGSYQYVWDRGLIVRNTSGKAVRVVGSTLDITERKLAEAARHKSQELLRTVVTNAPVVLYVLDKEGVFTLCEGKGLDSLGKKPGQSVGHSVFDLYRNNPEVGENIRRALAGTQVTWISHIGEVAFNNLVTPLRDETGQVYCLVGVATEITKLKRAEKARRESKRRFRAIFNNTFQYTGLLTPEGILLEANQAALDFIGSEANAVIGQPFWETPWWNFSPTIQQQLQAAITRVAAGEFVRYEVKIPDADGCLHAFDFSLKPIKDETGQVVLLIPEARDITEIKQAQVALTESEARLQAILDNSPVSIYLKDLQGRYLLINPECERLSGFSREQLIGKTDYEILPRVVADEFRANDQQVLDTLTPLVQEEVLPTQDGECTYITVKFPLFDAKGIPKAICGISTDITERKRAEEQIRFQARLLNAVEQAIMTTDLNGTITYWNRFAETLYGWQSAEAIGRNILEVTPAKVSKPLAAEILSCLQRGESWYGEFLVQRRDGTTFPAMVSDAPILDRDGVLIGIVGVTSDITQLKQAEAALKQANQELELRVQERTSALSETNRKLEAEIADRKIAEEELRRSEERFRRAIVHAPFPIMIHAEDGEVIQINQAWTEETGYIHSDIPTTVDWIARGYEERRELVKEGIDRLYDLDTKVEEGDFTIKTRHGEIKIWDFSSAPLGRLGNGKRLVISMAKDVTDRKQAEEALRQSEERYRSLVMASATYVWTADAQGEALIAPLPWQTLTGMSQEQWKGWGWLEALHPDDRERIAQLWRQAVETKCLYEAEFRQRTVDGSYRYFLVRGVPVFEADGSVREWVGANTDITDRKQAEEKLRQSEARFRATIEGSLDAFFIFESVRDEGGQIVDFAFVELNSNGEKMISRRKEEVIGKRLCELMPINRTDGFFEKYVRVVETQEVLEEEFLISSPEITASWLHHQVVPLADGIAVTSRDITQRKQAEEARKESEQRFRNLVETTSDWIWQVDENAVYTYVSPQVRDILGYEIEEVLGKTPFDLMPPTEAQRVAEIFSQIVASRQPFSNLENTNLHKDLHPVVLETSGVPVFDKAGNFRGYRGIDRDITRRKMAQKALRSSEERYRSLSACSPVGIFETDMAGRCLYTNPRYQEICGCTLEESLGEGWSRFVHLEDRDRVFAEWSLYARDGREYSDEFRIQTQEGIVRWVHVRSSPMFSAQGELIGHVGTVEDITSRRQAEANILAALHQEQELSELRNSFLSLVSHEFRTPLTTIRSSAELLDRYKNRLSDEKKQTHHQRIQSAIDRMTQLLDEVLLIGQAEAGKLKFEPQPIDLVPWCRDLVEGMIVVVENAHFNKSHQHAIAFTSSGECTDAQMDEKLLGHILTNLLSNAIKYSPEGGTVQFDLVCTAREAIFRITDGGIGIPEEYLPQLFESFQRASNVGAIQGTGLGLAIVKKAVDLHGGTIAVESEVGVGTTFTVRLPLKTSP